MHYWTQPEPPLLQMLSCRQNGRVRGLTWNPEQWALMYLSFLIRKRGVVTALPHRAVVQNNVSTFVKCLEQSRTHSEVLVSVIP